MSPGQKAYSERSRTAWDLVAEGVGFEPTVGCPTHAFQACRFGRSRIPPIAAAPAGGGQAICGTPQAPLRAAAFRP